MVELFVIVVLGALICGGVWTMAAFRQKALIWTWIIGAVAIWPAGTFSKWLIPLWFLCGVVATTLVRFHLPVRRTALVMLALAAGFVGFRAAEWSRQAAEIERLRADFPITDLSPRLQSLDHNTVLEGAIVSADRRGNAVVAAALPESTTSRAIQAQYDRREQWQRNRMLRTMASIHHNVEGEFRRREGFGAIRSLALSPRHEVLEVPEAPLIPRPRPSADPGSLPPLADAGLLSPSVSDLDQLHLTGQSTFFDLRSLGYVDRWHARNSIPSGSHVIGFRPHAFRETPRLKSAENRWVVAELELVSLLKDHSPAVYQSDYLPNLKQIIEEDFPIRPLDAFEQSALARLKSGEELVVDTLPGQIRALGALRAVHQCLECHTVPERTLLGAFTYRLHPTARPLRPAESTGPVL
jgi:hypothetical protein